MTNAFQKNIFIVSTNKNVKPIYNGKGNKVQFILIADFVFAAHGKRGI
jgi:hypothetical protein